MGEFTEALENLMELVSAAREYETREAESSLVGFVDRLSLLSEADEESGSREALVWMMIMDINTGIQVVGETMQAHPNLDGWFLRGCGRCMPSAAPCHCGKTQRATAA
jgi:hypothetical protein